MDHDSTLEDRSADGGSHGTIGPYRLLQKLGEGGMGEVWLAEQTEPVRRRVAIKVIKAGMDTKRVIARFEAERQALALMDHPAIAKVFDAGETPRGLPYFAMEYVRGEPITAYCDREKLTNDDRLRLFQQVCLGVQHAHQKGVIHRDLKPGNVLVTVQDGKAVPKIIDFGVAKAVSQRLTEKTLFTEQGVMIGTPEYMSPEQAEMSGLDVDTRTDVYSLGVVLYELVTGTLPFDAASLRSAGFDEIRRQIREVDPPPPSLRVSRAGGDSVESAARRRTDPVRLASRLRGEVDWIVMKAIEKDRTRRYASPSEISADLERYLADEPVLARAPSTAYRASKFVQRHKIGVAIVSVAILGLAAFGVTMAIQAHRIAMERDRAERVSDFLTNLFQAANPAQAKGKTVTARDLLDEGAGRIEKDTSLDPLVRAQLMHTMGSAYRILGLCEESARALEPAVRVRTQELGRNATATIESVTELGGALWCAGKLPEAEAQLRSALDRSRSALGPDSAIGIHAQHSLGGVLREEQRLDQAEAAYRDALDRAQRTTGPESSLTLGILSDLSSVVAERDPAKAIPLVKDLLPRLRASVGEDDPLYVVALANLANDLSTANQEDEAIRVAEDALPRARRALGDLAEATINLRTTLTGAYNAQRRDADAEKAANDLIETATRARGEEDERALYGKAVLGSVYMRQQRYADAERVRTELLAVKRRTLGESSPAVSDGMYNLACTTALAGKRAEALDWLGQSVSHGFHDADHMMEDTDLLSLHGDPRFAAVVAQARK